MDDSMRLLKEILRWTAVAVWCTVCVSCSTQEGAPPEQSTPAAQSAISTDTTVSTPRVIEYRHVPVAGRSGLDSLRNAVGADHVSTILRLNRKDNRHVLRNDTLVVPDTLVDFMAYSPFPQQVPSAEAVRKLVVVDQRIQAIAAYEYGALVFWCPTSTGKKSTPTDTGLFHTNWRSRKRNSTVNNEWVLEWYWNLDNRSGVSLHQYELPGYPASHACIRLLEEDAKWFYDWCYAWKVDSSTVVAQGTPFVIYNMYNFGERAPWKLLPESPGATRVELSTIDSVLAPYLPVLLREQQVRDSVLAQIPTRLH